LLTPLLLLASLLYNRTCCCWCRYCCGYQWSYRRINVGVPAVVGALLLLLSLLLLASLMLLWLPCCCWRHVLLSVSPQLSESTK
jgi:hypothetical protein